MMMCGRVRVSVGCQWRHYIMNTSLPNHGGRYLNNNNLTSLPPGVFSNLPSLQQLYAMTQCLLFCVGCLNIGWNDDDGWESESGCVMSLAALCNEYICF